MEIKTMTYRYSAEAALNLEGNPDKQEYQTFTGPTLDIVVKKAEARSVTGEAYSVCREVWEPQYHHWFVDEQIVIY